MHYYNEIDPKCCAWLRELIADGLIPDGEIDCRSIVKVEPADLRGFKQCHLFAGIGGWSLALKLAGWPEDREVWTGSCPCQPYSVGSVAHGGAKGPGDCRDLWPSFARLIEQRKPSVVFGEQVASAIGWGWLDRLSMGLEPQAYSIGAAVLRAKTVGADHERKRLYWLAHSCGEGRQGHQQVKRLSIATAAAQPINGDPLVRARRALAGDYSDLLPCDGLSVQLERDAIKAYGNAIVPQLAAEFIRAAEEAIK